MTPDHRPAVVLVAHGSRDPRAAASTALLARAVQRARPEWRVRASYLDHDGPRPFDVLAAVPGPRAVLVPLLLTAAYHGRVDLPAVIRDAATLPLTVTATDVLGPASPLLLAALNRRLTTALPTYRPSGPALDSPEASPGHRSSVVDPDSLLFGTEPGHRLSVPGDRLSVADQGCRLFAGGLDAAASDCRPPLAGLDAVVLAAAGTRDDAARGTVADAAVALGRLLGLPSAVSYASGPGARADEAVTRLREAGARRIGVAAYFLAPGLLYDAAIAAAISAGAVAVAEPLGDAPELVRLVVSRAEPVLSRPLAVAA
ncbi:sirohydrochlorin chelatase [Actinoplanes derwentensis]|uniref:Sirohydrochlorin ferrochelatase n=1 Tax=Actinoplanes derwentensis TaxID=113562 RepID=A0A1H2D2G3_9ACTN|nr:CbiX/SirB N-terminal domain-containing protein [Actinoplanes derwentensis]SDT76968.1 Sirohydrochlorin ferrochelatase [Actinoplanes derwentensis]